MLDTVQEAAPHSNMLDCSNGEVSAPDPKIRGPVPFIHVDYTLASGPERVETLLPQDEADRLRKTPFAVIQACQLASYLPQHVGAMRSVNRSQCSKVKGPGGSHASAEGLP